jgi:hypothetical protein
MEDMKTQHPSLKIVKIESLIDNYNKVIVSPLYFKRLGSMTRNLPN